MEQYHQALERMTEKLYRNALIYGTDLPSAVGTVDGLYTTANGKGHWTDGFWPGLLLLGYAQKGDHALLTAYERYESFLAERIANDPRTNEKKNYIPLDHDVGFIFFLTSVFHSMLTGETRGIDVGLSAAETLSARFHENGDFIRAWDDWPWDTPEFRAEKKGKAIVDSLMNLPLLFWATDVSGNSRYRERAIRHAERLAETIVRPDGSTFHTFNFDPATGNPVAGCSAQGYADDSCWSRGHAWAIYGFSLCFRYTGLPAFADTARRCIAYWERSLLPNGDAPWDFETPREERLPIDTSAMAIAACGMLELASGVPDGEAYASLAKRMLDRLLTAHASLEPSRANAFLLHGSVGPAYKRGSAEEAEGNYRNSDQSLIYGDYFVYEALLRACRPDVRLPWHYDAGIRTKFTSDCTN